MPEALLRQQPPVATQPARQASAPPAAQARPGTQPAYQPTPRAAPAAASYSADEEEERDWREAAAYAANANADPDKWRIPQARAGAPSHERPL